MRVLIVETDPDLGRIWQRYIQRQGAQVDRVDGQSSAIHALCLRPYDILVVNLVLEEGGALAIADFASYRRPDARVIFVTNTSFFSDGSIFNHSATACAFVQTGTPPEDLAAMVAHYGTPEDVPTEVKTS